MMDNKTFFFLDFYTSTRFYSDYTDAEGNNAGHPVYSNQAS